MSADIIWVKPLNEGLDITDFFIALSTHRDISQNFGYTRFDVTTDEFCRAFLRDYIAREGVSSLFKFSLACDAVMHKGIHVDEIEKVMLRFMQRLQGVRNLLIIDGYFYADGPNCVTLFERMISAIGGCLETVTFLTYGRKNQNKSAMHEALRKSAPAAKIIDIVTDDFHDRYWIDIDNDKGVLMGTSLNGIGKKFALIDKLSNTDAKEITGLARALIKEGS